MTTELTRSKAPMTAWLNTAARTRRQCLLVGLAVALAGPVAAQNPTPDQAREILQNRPDLARRVQTWIGGSGLTPAQVRARLTAAGYPATLLDAYFGGPTGTGPAPSPPSDRVLEAVRSLGMAESDELPDIPPDLMSGQPGQRRTDTRDSISGPRIFGRDVFRRVTNQFQPAASGPVDPSYRLGPGDQLVLVLTGDVEAAYTLDVAREGFIVVPQVGQLHVAGLTMASLESLLFVRLGKVYSGVRRSLDATTMFQVSVARLRTNQVFVVGDVEQPGAYQVPGAGTALTALYLAGGPTAMGSFRNVQIRRAGALIDSLDLYDYLLRGDNGHDRRLETGDVVFVPLRRIPVEVAGAVARPAIYELRTGETLSDLIRDAGGFAPAALRRRIQIDRVLPVGQREFGGRDRVILDIPERELAGDLPPPVPMAPADRVEVFEVATRRRNLVTVKGNVWTAGRIGFTQGMKLSEAIRLAGGPKPDVYLGQILISRLNSDSTRSQLRSSFRDSVGGLTADLDLREDDEVTIFSRTTFRPDRYVTITGAVNRPGRVRYRDGMTLRDALLEVDGLAEFALLTEAELARMPNERSTGSLSTTMRVALDSTYVFDRGPRGEYSGPPGIAARPTGAPEVPLAPYDNVLILRQPDWELQRSVTIVGQVRSPGTYTLRTKTDRLSDLIGRAGGLSSAAYARGAELYRREYGGGGVGLAVAGRLESERARSFVDTAAAKRPMTPARLGDDLARRVGLDLAKALGDPGSTANLILQAGDSVFVPEFAPTIRVLGAVNAPTTVIHRAGWKIDQYIAAAGGFSRQADRGRAYVVQPGGQLEVVKRRLLWPDSKPTPLPGAVVVVPERDPAEKKDWAGLLGSIAQILASTLTIIVVATK